MTTYQDIYSDLPSRVYEVWRRAKGQTDNSQRDLSVTAMLMAAAAGLAMPWESLKNEGVGNRQDWNSHPAFKGSDQKSYQRVLATSNKFFATKLIDCRGHEDISLYRCAELSAIKDTVEYGSGSTTPLKLEDYDVRFAIKIIRNALSHNNIVAFGNSLNQIEKLGFFSENRSGHGCKSTVDGWNVLVTSVETFRSFLRTWFALLRTRGSWAPVGMTLVVESGPTMPS